MPFIPDLEAYISPHKIGLTHKIGLVHKIGLTPKEARAALRKIS